ncbi:MAG: branched-chain amino acid ABC transporter permease [Planctomycetota bacterium]|jgi:branched-subunit amino acid ABC-type transport system permease component|nr:branched-chain amino acid ABC transporter permease [Planctomycetota bacterium]
MQIPFNIFISLGVYALVALSVVMVYYPAKFFPVTHAATITVAPYLTYFYFQEFYCSLFFSVVGAIITASTIGILGEIFIYNPLRKRGASPMIMMIASLGVYIVLQNIISILWGDDTKSIIIDEIKVGNELWGAYITNIQVTTIAISFALFVGCILFMKYQRIGRNIRAVASNPELSNIFGIDSNRTILWAFGIGSALAAVAGIGVAFDTGMHPTMGFNILLYGIVVMIIGGVGSMWWLFGGALLLATAQHLSAYYIGSQWMDAVAYIILIIFLIGRPLGFSGKRLKKIEL